MSSYFDNAAREVAEDFSRIEEVEERVIRDVNLVTGDREFPDEMRQRMQGVIATKQHKTRDGLPPTKAREMNESTKMSHLIEDLHECFHDLARQRIKIRFGLLSDSPRRILAQRNAHVSSE